MAEEKIVTLTPNDLKELIASAVQAAVESAKKPSAQEQKRIDAEETMIKMANESRLEQRDQVLAGIESKRQIQRMCSHKHGASAGGGSHCVYISNGGYLLCQKNQCIIRPGPAPKNYKGGTIYDSELFNQLAQELAPSELIG